MKKNYKKILLIFFISLLCIIILGYGLFQVSKLRTFQFFGGITAKVETEKKVVALTFDDAPSPQTDAILKILSDKNIKATFYVIGQNAKEYPNELKKIVEQGNELGNHTYSHQRMVLKSPSFVEKEIESTNQLIRDAGYKDEITFRPPNGKKLLILPWYLNKNNVKTIMWSIEPDTYYSGNAEAITNYVSEKVEPGSIILMHPFCSTSCEADRLALPKIIDNLKAQGYEFVTVSQLLNINN